MPTKEQATNNQTQVNMLLDTIINEEGLTTDELEYLFPDAEVVPYDIQLDNDQILAFTNSSIEVDQLPEGAVIAHDPYDKYYCMLPAGQEPDKAKLHVAKELYALQAVLPLVNNHLQVEFIIDPGCQI